MSTQPVTERFIEQKLVFSGKEVDALLKISATTRWRLEKKNLLKAVPGIRRKLYSRRAVEAFLNREEVDARS